ncbi:MAG: hypothetical protein ACJ77D_10310 [Chloroflexota bacterium]|jgi:hypothetical protein
MTRILVCAALLLAVAACSPAAVNESSVPGASAVVAASAEGTASASTRRTPARLAGFAKLLEAGPYIFEDAMPHVTLDVPADWYLSETMPRHFGLHPGDVLENESLRIWFDMRVASKDSGCPETPQAGVGHLARDLVSDFTSDRRLSTTTPKPVSVGGLTGQVLDVGVAADWKRDCPFDKGKRAAPLFLDDNVDGEPAFWGVTGPEKLRLMVLDDGHSSNVVVMVDSTSGTTLDQLETAVKPVLDSFRFQTGL